MKIDFDAVVRDIYGETMKRPGRKAGDPEIDATLAYPCVEALMGTFEDERNLSGNEKAERYAMAGKIVGGGIVDLKTDDITKLKALVAKAYPTMIVGAVWDLLEGKRSKSPGA